MTTTDTSGTERPSFVRDGTWPAAVAVWVVGYVALAIFMLLIT